MRAMRVAALLVAILLLSSSMFFLAQGKSDPLTIRYILLELSADKKRVLSTTMGNDVKSGDAILLTTPDGLHVLIDSGIPHVSDQLYKRLTELGVTRLDYAIATHPHVDHIGGFPALIEQLEFGKFYQINIPHLSSRHYDRLQEVLSATQIETGFLGEGDILQIGDHLQFEVLNPPAGLGPHNLEPSQLTTQGINNLSLVMRLDYLDFSMLFTADIYRETEGRLVDGYSDKIDVRVVDVPHHGSTTSSTTEFIQTISPEIAVISRDELLSSSIYNRYRRSGAAVYATSLNGDVLLVTDGYTIDVITEREHDNPYLR